MSFAVLCLSVLVILPAAANAQEAATGEIDIIPVSALPEGSAYADQDGSTHPTVKLTPDKSELIRLDQKAGTIIIGNPAHLSVLAESAQTLVLVPRQPGATHITVLDHRGGLIMQRHVIVASPKEKYVRIRRSCATSDAGACAATQVYYCPDMCHEIALSTDSEVTAPDAEALTQTGGQLDEATSEATDEVIE